MHLMHAFGVHGTEVIKKRRAIMISIKSLGLTTGILGACSIFFLSWWLILIVNADGPVTICNRKVANKMVLMNSIF